MHISLELRSNIQTIIYTFVITAVGSAFAEICSLPFYYPFDLVKVRMQTMQGKYGYKNLIDATIKIWNEEQKGKNHPRMI